MIIVEADTAPVDPATDCTGAAAAAPEALTYPELLVRSETLSPLTIILPVEMISETLSLAVLTVPVVITPPLIAVTLVLT